MRDDLERLGDELAYESMSNGPTAAIAKAETVLAEAEDGDTGLRCFLLGEIGQYAEMAGDPAGAVQAWEDSVALAGGDPVPRAFLAAALLGAGRRADAEVEIRALRRTRPTVVSVHLVVGEALEAVGDLGSAIGWFTSGVRLALDQDEPDLIALLHGRRRVRAASGLPPDDWEDLAGDLRIE